MSDGLNPPVTDSRPKNQTGLSLLVSLAPSIVGMAFGSLRANRMRSLLTTLGVVVGVGTVVGMASIIQGFNKTVQSSISSFGSHVIYVRKFKPGFYTGGFPDSLRNRHAFTKEDADAIREQCPNVGEVAIIGFVEGTIVSHRGKSTRSVQLIGTNPAIQEVHSYDPWLGRFFTEEEVRRNSQVVIIGKDIRDALFTGGSPIGKTVHINRIPFRVVGELTPRGRSLFSNPDEMVTVPYSTLQKYFPPPDNAPFYIPKRGEYYLNVSAISPEQVPVAVDEITEVMRRRRGLGARQANNFEVFTEDALADLYKQLTGATYFVMILISSIALLVGGIGVMNIMLVAVTERTREIGLRKAVGAPRATIMAQFLVEAATITGLGGILGIGMGAGLAQLVRALSGLPAYTPIWSVVVAFLFSVVVGLFFGLYPALRAARLDPVDSLRWE